MIYRLNLSSNRAWVCVCVLYSLLLWIDTICVRHSYHTESIFHLWYTSRQFKEKMVNPVCFITWSFLSTPLCSVKQDIYIYITYATPPPPLSLYSMHIFSNITFPNSHPYCAQARNTPNASSTPNPLTFILSARFIDKTARLSGHISSSTMYTQFYLSAVGQSQNYFALTNNLCFIYKWG